MSPTIARKLANRKRRIERNLSKIALIGCVASIHHKQHSYYEIMTAVGHQPTEASASSTPWPDGSA